MLRELLEKMPFWHHQPPLNLPFRRLVIMAMSRPVDLVEMEARITHHLRNTGPDGLEELRTAIAYLRKRRFRKRDCANLFVAGTRAACSIHAERGLEFAHGLIHEVPDSRAIRTMVTYLNRLDRPEESLALLKLTRSSRWTREMRRMLNLRVHGPPPDSGDAESAPWIFQMKNSLKLTRQQQFLQYPLSENEGTARNGIRQSFELTGTLVVKETESPNAVLASFLFFDQDDAEIRGVEPGGLVRSKTVGWYAYLNHDSSSGDFTLDFEPPFGTRRIIIGFRLWNTKSRILLEPGLDIRPSSLEEFHRDLERFLYDVSQCDAEQVVFMFSGTTYVQELRANRPIRLTRDLLNRDIPVIFNYHRWRRTDERPPYEGDLLLQIPIDITEKMLGDIAGFDFGSRRKIFIVSYPHPSIPKTLNRFKVNGWSTMYDARDEWEEFEKVGQAKWYRTFNEKYIVHNVDHVTSVSGPLARKLDGFNPAFPVEVVPNALSPHFLSQGYRWKGDSIVRVGYFGHLTASWFDWESLFEIAEKRPRYIFEIIGHSEPDDLVLPPNVVLMGSRTHAEINEIAAHWRVAIIPFKMGLLADGVDPIKIYEYMALELPTVSFRMPQIDDYPSTITVDNVSDFCSALDEFANYRPRKGMLKAWLATNRWSDRVDRILELAKTNADEGIVSLGVTQ